MKKYKIIKLNDKEIKDIKILIAQELINLKSKDEDDFYTKVKISKYQKLLNYFSYIER